MPAIVEIIECDCDSERLSPEAQIEMLENQLRMAPTRLELLRVAAERDNAIREKNEADRALYAKECAIRAAMLG